MWWLVEKWELGDVVMIGGGGVGCGVLVWLVFDKVWGDCNGVVGRVGCVMGIG